MKSFCLQVILGLSMHVHDINQLLLLIIVCPGTSGILLRQEVILNKHGVILT